MQLELAFWPRDCVRSVLAEYLSMRSETITAETREDDYRVRMEWLIEMLGEMTPVAAVTFLKLETVARTARGLGLADKTIKMRLQFWAAAVEYASLREIVTCGRPKLPPWLRAGRKHDDFHTPAQFAEFRLALPPSKIRRFADLAMWTGQHTRDIETMERWMLEPDFEWEGTDRRGRWWRRNSKTRDCVPCWIPMEAELRALAIEWLAKPGDPHAFITGAVHNKRKYFDLAAERSGQPRIRANLALRASHASELLARNHTHEYVRLVLGHRGEIRAEIRPADPDGNHPGGGPRAATVRPSTLSGHYLRNSPNTLRPQ